MILEIFTERFSHDSNVVRSIKYVLGAAKGVDPDKKVRGTDWCVTQHLPAGGLGGAVSPPAGSGAEPRRQIHFGTNVLKINSKSGPFSVTVYTPNSDPISNVHWLLQRKIGSVVRGCAKTC